MLNHNQAVRAYLGVLKIGLDILAKKRKNYSGDTDPFGNFRNATSIGVLPERGVLVRMSDKISRVGQMADRVEPFDGDPEHPLVDGLRDIPNYVGIVAGLFAEHDPALLDFLVQQGDELIEAGLHQYIPPER